MRDLAYGRRPLALEEKEEEEDTVEPGQNLLDVHFSKVKLYVDILESAIVKIRV